jgi:hypothetical protein
VIQGSVFLQQHDNVVNRRDALRRWRFRKCRSHTDVLPIRHAELACHAATAATEAGESKPCRCGRGECDRCPIAETRCAGGWTINPSRAAGDAAIASHRNRQLHLLWLRRRRGRGRAVGVTTTSGEGQDASRNKQQKQWPRTHEDGSRNCELVAIGSDGVASTWAEPPAEIAPGGHS